MPFYTTVNKLLLTLPMVGSVTSITSADLASFIDDADAIINSKLSKQYTVPVSGAPLLDSLAADIALARLLTRRIFTQEQANNSTWPDEYKKALDTLDAIANGEMTLVTSAGTIIAAASTEGGVWSNNMNYVPTMNEDDPGTNYIDSDKLTGILDDR
jgi:phage gp36-like protein